MARTRSKGGSASTAAAKSDNKNGKPNTSKSSTSVYSLPAESSNPPKLFILPQSATPAARIVTLQHPRYNKPARYLVCPSAGFFEFTSLSPPKSSPRSWLIQTTTPTKPDQPATATTTQTTQSPALHLATPYDPLFLLLPALCTTPTETGQQQEKQKRMFLALDDHLDALPDPARHLAELVATCPAVRALLEARLQAVCDVVQAGDESMYRVNEGKLLGEVWGKARRMVAGSGSGGDGDGAGPLPGSMEERFVRRELEAPVLGVKIGGGMRVGGSGSVTPSGEEGADSQESVSSAGTEASAVSAASTAATSVAGEDGASGGPEVVSAMTASAEVVRLQWLRVAFNFICSSYVAPATAEVLKRDLAKAIELVDFKPLDGYLAKLTKLRQEAAAARSSDFSRKRLGEEEEDERAEKRRKQEAEDKAKKANMSRGVKNLMKVNTSGMKKMSDFFKKKA